MKDDTDGYMDELSKDAATFSGRLDFTDSVDQLFKFSINPIKIDQSCRFQRHFGADRFFILDVPSLAPDYYKHIPSALKKSRDNPNGLEPQEIHRRVMMWLFTGKLHIDDRQWRAFFIEPKDSTVKKRKEEGLYMRVHLFATDGTDFGTKSCRQVLQTLGSFLNWHLDFANNRKSTDLKLFSRVRLGLSRTIPTV